MTARTIRLAAILVIISVSTFITAVILYDFISVSSNFILVWQNYIFQGLWCLTPLSTIFQLYRGGFIGGGNWSTQRKTPTCHKTLTNFIT